MVDWDSMRERRLETNGVAIFFLVTIGDHDQKCTTIKIGGMTLTGKRM